MQLITWAKRLGEDPSAAKTAMMNQIKVMATATIQIRNTYRNQLEAAASTSAATTSTATPAPAATSTVTAVRRLAGSRACPCRLAFADMLCGVRRHFTSMSPAYTHPPPPPPPFLSASCLFRRHRLRRRRPRPWCGCRQKLPTKPRRSHRGDAPRRSPTLVSWLVNGLHVVHLLFPFLFFLRFYYPPLAATPSFRSFVRRGCGSVSAARYHRPG